MKCPTDGARLSCIDTRAAAGPDSLIRRRYECPQCKERFTSVEEILPHTSPGEPLIGLYERRLRLERRRIFNALKTVIGDLQ